MSIASGVTRNISWRARIVAVIFGLPVLYLLYFFAFMSDRPLGTPQLSALNSRPSEVLMGLLVGLVVSSPLIAAAAALGTRTTGSSPTAVAAKVGARIGLALASIPCTAILFYGAILSNRGMGDAASGMLFGVLIVSGVAVTIAVVLALVCGVIGGVLGKLYRPLDA